MIDLILNMNQPKGLKVNQATFAPISEIPQGGWNHAERGGEAKQLITEEPEIAGGSAHISPNC